MWMDPDVDGLLIGRQLCRWTTVLSSRQANNSNHTSTNDHPPFMLPLPNHPQPVQEAFNPPSMSHIPPVDPLSQALYRVNLSQHPNKPAGIVGACLCLDSGTGPCSTPAWHLSASISDVSESAAASPSPSDSDANAGSTAWHKWTADRQYVALQKEHCCLTYGFLTQNDNMALWTTSSSHNFLYTWDSPIHGVFTTTNVPVPSTWYVYLPDIGLTFCEYFLHPDAWGNNAKYVESLIRGTSGLLSVLYAHPTYNLGKTFFSD